MYCVYKRRVNSHLMYVETHISTVMGLTEFMWRHVVLIHAMFVTDAGGRSDQRAGSYCRTLLTMDVTSSNNQTPLSYLLCSGGLKSLSVNPRLYLLLCGGLKFLSGLANCQAFPPPPPPFSFLISVPSSSRSLSVSVFLCVSVTLCLSACVPVCLSVRLSLFLSHPPPLVLPLPSTSYFPVSDLCLCCCL